MWQTRLVRGDGQHANPPLTPHPFAGEQHAVQSGPHSIQKHSTITGQLYSADANALNSESSQVIFECADLMAYCALCQG